MARHIKHLFNSLLFLSREASSGYGNSWRGATTWPWVLVCPSSPFGHPVFSPKSTSNPHPQIALAQPWCWCSHWMPLLACAFATSLLVWTSTCNWFPYSLNNFPFSYPATLLRLLLCCHLFDTSTTMIALLSPMAMHSNSFLCLICWQPNVSWLDWMCWLLWSP